MQRNLVLLSISFSVIFFTISLFSFSFFNREIDNNKREFKLDWEEWHKEAVRRDEMRTLDSSVKLIEKERAELDTHFAKSSDIVPLLNTIESLAPKVGAKAEVTSVDILNYNMGLLVGVKASGTFAGLYKFMTLLENSPYELEFLSMQISKEGGVTIGIKNVVSAKWSLFLKIKLLSFIP